MTGEYSQTKVLLGREDFIKNVETLGVLFAPVSGGGEAVRQLRFSPFRGTCDAQVSILTSSPDYRSIVLNYDTPCERGLYTRQSDITRSHALRLIAGDYTVTDELPGRFPADINAFMRAECYVPHSILGYIRATFENSAKDVAVTYDFDIGVSVDVKHLFEDVSFSPVHIGAGILTLNCKGSLYGAQKDVVTQLLNCGYPL